MPAVLKVSGCNLCLRQLKQLKRPCLVFVSSVAALVISFTLVAIVIRSIRERNRQQFIEDYQWPPGVLGGLAKTYPDLSPQNHDTVGRGLKQFFQSYRRSKYQFVSMPSQVADELWHSFIVDTRAYDAFCRRAFGRFLHHKPATTLSPVQKSNAGLRRVWWHSCKLEKLDPAKPAHLPLLFALDGLFNIPGGYRYTADCAALRAAGFADTYCGGDFGDSSFDGGTAGFGDSSGSGDTSGSGDSSSGDGGGGCGGGGD